MSCREKIRELMSEQGVLPRVVGELEGHCHIKEHLLKLRLQSRVRKSPGREASDTISYATVRRLLTEESVTGAISHFTEPRHYHDDPHGNSYASSGV